MMNRRVFDSFGGEGNLFYRASLWAKSTFGKQRRGASIVQKDPTESKLKLTC